MIHNSASHRVFKIGELTRLIASQLISIDRGSVVNLACACRCLEEPVLSTLWEIQWLLDILLGVLPEGTWNFDGPGLGVFKIVGKPSPESWNRVRRYASWMRNVGVDESSVLTEDTYRKFRLNSPAGGWFPLLRNLSWCITKANLPYTDLFFSPYLEGVTIHVSWSLSIPEVPRDVPPAIASAISTLPASALESLFLEIDHRGMPSAYFKDSVSSVVLRCGPALTEFLSPVPLSEAAVNHLIQLPHLRTWRIGGPPPKPASASSLVLPPLTKLTLGEHAARGWLSLFKHLEHGISTAHGPAPLSRVKESLKSLDIEKLRDPIIDAPFTSTIQLFRNLVSLNVRTNCHNGTGEDRCTFYLNNDDVAGLATTLPQINHLSLGRPCFKNTCATTVACLLLLSTHCIKLKSLEIHFNTTNIVGDFADMVVNSRLLEIDRLPRCKLSRLDVSRTPLDLSPIGFELVATGMRGIFPDLGGIAGQEQIWHELNERMERPP